jgi:hypothetical protein
VSRHPLQASLLLAVGLTLAACGGSSHQPGPRSAADEPAGSADDYAARIEHLERELTTQLDSAPEQLAEPVVPDCDAAPDLRDRICALADRICAIAAQTPTDTRLAETCTRARDSCNRATDQVTRLCAL